MGKRIRIDAQSPIGKVKRFFRYCEELELGGKEFFWKMFDAWEYDPQNFSSRVKRKIIRGTHLYQKDTPQDYIEMCIDYFEKENPVKFEFNA